MRWLPPPAQGRHALPPPEPEPRDDELRVAAAPIAQQEAAGFIRLSTSAFAALAATVTLCSAYWPDSRFQQSVPVLALATVVLTGLAVSAWLRPPSLRAAPHLVGLNSIVLSAAAAAHVLITDDPVQVQFLIVVVSGIGARVSVTRWLVAGNVVCWTPVVGALLVSPTVAWLNSALVLAAATALGAVVHLGSKRREEQIDGLNARMRRQAHHDGLTGLANRHGLELLAGMAVSGAQRLGHDVALLFIDLDGFKEVNDQQGHQAGDELLQEVARHLDADFRGGDVVARIGGDEFVVLVSGPDLDAGQLSDRCRRVLRAAGQDASVGCAVSPGAAESLETLLSRADAAMYSDKRARRAGQPASG